MVDTDILSVDDDGTCKALIVLKAELTDSGEAEAELGTRDGFDVAG